jgi:tetratricopeptide (TPR) repeat protein
MLLKIIVILLSGYLMILAFPQSATADDSDIKAAAKAYKEGKAAFEQGNFKEALAAFTESYNLSEKPDLLYNLAICNEKMGEKEKAIALYELYLEEKPQAEDKKKVQKKVAELKGLASAADDEKNNPASQDMQSGSETGNTTAEKTDETTADKTSNSQTDLSENMKLTVAPPKDPAVQKRRLAQGLLIGIGSLTLASGILTGIASYKNYNTYKDTCSPYCSDDKVSKVKGLAIAADIQMGIGIAAIASGIIWLVVDKHKSKKKMKKATLPIINLADGMISAGLIKVF